MVPVMLYHPELFYLFDTQGYLTQIDPLVNEVAGHYNDPLIAQEIMKELRRRGEWGVQKTGVESTAPRMPPA